MSETTGNNDIAEQMTISIAKEFAKLFSGRSSAYGQFVLAPGLNEAKVKGKCSTVQAPVTDDLYLKHLRGELGLGIVPIKENNTCNFAVIDIDIYTDAIQAKVISAIDTLRAPLVTFRSKSGGLHIYCFFSEEVKANVVIDIMRKFKSLLGLEKEVEVFPKQAKTTEKDIGNWINLPLYHAGVDCKRNMVMPERVIVSNVARILARCTAMQVTAAEVQNYFDSLPLVDAPPCLQRIYLAGHTNNRNIYLFALGRYYKAKYGEQFEEYLLEANKQLSDPLPLSEVIGTIAVSLKKKDYSYTCAQSPLCDFCDKRECAKRKYGIGGKEVSNLNFGEFRQILTDPPTYEWVINEKVLQFDSAAAIINQIIFREQCVDKLHILPNRLNDPAWASIVNEALGNVKEISVDPEDDISPGAMIMNHVIEFVKKRAPAPNRLGILRGMTFKDTTEGFESYVFDIKSLVLYLVNVKQIHVYKLTDLKTKIVKIGGRAVRYYINDANKEAMLWCISIKALDARSREMPAEPENDFITSLNRAFEVS